MLLEIENARKPKKADDEGIDDGVGKNTDMDEEELSDDMVSDDDDLSEEEEDETE